MADRAVAVEIHAGARGRMLARFAWFAVFYNVLVVLWGALVRASGSGAGCGNHWPLCNGQVIPVSPGMHTVIEFTHRMMTGGAAFVVLGLLVWTFRATARRDAVRFFAVTAGVLLLNEALLGALLVKLGYVGDNLSIGRMVVLSIHLSNTLLLLAALALTARFVSIPSPQSWTGLRRARGLGWAVAGLIATIGVGVSGSMAALGDTLFPASTFAEAMAQDFATTSPLLLRLRFLHPLSALAAAAFVIWLIFRARRGLVQVGRGRQSGVSEMQKDLRSPARVPQFAGLTLVATLTLGLLALQFLLGIADILLLAPAWMQLLHLLGADLYWITLVALAAETLWPVTAPATVSIASAPAGSALLA